MKREEEIGEVREREDKREEEITKRWGRRRNRSRSGYGGRRESRKTRCSERMTR